MGIQHDSVVRLLERFLWEGEEIPEATWQHVAACGSCLQALGLICETVERGTSGRLEAIAQKLPCDAVLRDLHEYAGLEPRHVVRRHPAVAIHLEECGNCKARYLAARAVIAADQEGLFGLPVSVPEVGTVGWNELPSRVFRLASEIVIRVRREMIAFLKVPPELGRNAYALASVGATRMAHVENPEPDAARNQGADAVEVGLDLTPPNLGQPLKLRLLPEADGHTSAIIAMQGVASIVTLALYREEPTRDLLEVRSLTPQQMSARIDRLPAGRYELEIRAPDGAAIIPIELVS